MRLTYLACTFTILVACSPGTGTTDTADSTGPTTSLTSSTSSTSGATDTTETTTGTPTPTTSTSDPTTGATTTTAGTSETTASDTTDPDTTAGTTGASDNSCVVDADCALHSDCCSCEGVRFDVDVPSCDENCEQPLCAAFGIDEARCRIGVCEAERLTCDQSKVACDEAPPPCRLGNLPEVEGVCYTGACVPAFRCDVVPDCSHCGADQLCVQNVSFGVDSVRCEPIPPGCGGVVDCACVSELVCTGMYSACFQPQEGAVVSCECLNC